MVKIGFIASSGYPTAGILARLAELPATDYQLHLWRDTPAAAAIIAQEPGRRITLLPSVESVIDRADTVEVFWDGASKRTAHAVGLARNAAKLARVHRLGEPVCPVCGSPVIWSIGSSDTEGTAYCSRGGMASQLDIRTTPMCLWGSGRVIRNPDGDGILWAPGHPRVGKLVGHREPK